MVEVFGFDLDFTTPTGKTIYLGRLAVRRNGSQVESAFKFSSEYLNDKQLPDLCPAYLLARDGTFPCHTGIHGVFEDILPDVWGRGLLRRTYSLSNKDCIPAIYLGLLDNPMGAISVRQTIGKFPVKIKPKEPELPLDLIMEHSLTLEAGGLLDEHLLRQLTLSGSSGGARPKALSAFGGRLCLFKFVSKEDSFPMIQAEAACMSVAESLGLEPPTTRLISLKNRPVLVLDRFDVTESGGRNHMITMKTVLGSADATMGSYLEIATCLKTVVVNPAKDLIRLFKQMLFNVLVGNIDDHLKNFSLLHTEDGWHLSNAYDITPAVMQNIEGGKWHSIGFDPSSPDPCDPSIQDWDDIGEKFGLSPGVIEYCKQKVLSSISELESAAMNEGITKEDWRSWLKIISERSVLIK